MASNQINQSIKDIIPSYSGENRRKLSTYIDSLYNISLRKSGSLPNNAEIGRYHLCTFVIAEKFQTIFNLPTPDVTKIPIKPQVVMRLLDDFRELVNQMSAASTPTSSPRKRQSTPLKNSAPNNPEKQSGSPLKKLKAAAVAGDLEENNDDDKPSSPPGKKTKSSFVNKTNTPTRGNYKYTFKLVSLSEFITFCNTFYIPSKYTVQMLSTFYSHKHKFAKKSDWSLACGIVYTAYIRINHRLLHDKIGAKAEFMNLLLQYQKGALSKASLQSWCTLIEEWIREEPWVQDIEKQYMYGNEALMEKTLNDEYIGMIGEGWDLMERFGAMIHGEVLYQSDTQNKYFATWSKKIVGDL
ncbi:unnamed protein product [Candida parapsilosis]|uniref:ORC6 first cyclin-like domain-containing protein n=1 Tax=Candida parapsilosis (strain CDC 317 / ATCC MYA-4646) TaxID=578454 RepID=G8B629_CANPC|nr:uncharacterized protein CPAR2_109960 [Candida parapsilosis]CCE40958.1 hypothetical protein CPAR2_109960 [Candida parapsilosis]